jgi:hypothetical protein
MSDHYTYMAFGYVKGVHSLCSSHHSSHDQAVSGSISPAWENGESCADCGKCCKKIQCPLQEETYNRCMGYDSFYWRYFNCGRYPAGQGDIDRYECPKWVMRP